MADIHTKMLILQSKTNLDGKILFGKVTNLLEPDVRKMLVRCMFGNENSTFHSDLSFTCY